MSKLVRRMRSFKGFFSPCAYESLALVFSSGLLRAMSYDVTWVSPWTATPPASTPSPSPRPAGPAGYVAVRLP